MSSQSTHTVRFDDIKHAWHLIDAKGQPLGRLASTVAQLLRGKHKPTFSNHLDNGDGVIVINAEKVVLTGKKWEKKFYYHHSQIPGGLNKEAYRSLRDRKPEFMIEKAVRGMLTRNCLGRRIIGKLKVYRGSNHPHAAQKPTPYTVSR